MIEFLTVRGGSTEGRALNIANSDEPSWPCLTDDPLSFELPPGRLFREWVEGNMAVGGIAGMERSL